MNRSILAALCAVLAAGCSGSGATGVAAGPDEVVMQGTAFNPPSRTVRSGTTVTWINQDGTAHTTTRGTGKDEWDSGVLAANQSFSHTFDVPGSFPYVCTLHQGMNGTIVVTE